MMHTKIIDIDLTAISENIKIEQDYSCVQAVIRWKRKPLGIIDVDKNDGIVNVQDIYARSLSLFNEVLISEAVIEKFGIKENYPPISVVICTRDRANLLKRCLASVENLDYSDYEIIVVDNCTKDNSVNETAHEFNVKYFREDKPGLNCARNRGIREATYNIVAFIDDDAVADSIWLKGIAEAFSDTETSVVTGLVLPAEIKNNAQYYFEKYGGMSKGFNSFSINSKNIKRKQLYWASSWGVGANMAFKKEVFEKAGYFNEALDVGTPTSGGGDIEMFFRAVYYGLTLRYEPKAVIKHYHRESYKEFLRQVYNNGKSFPAYILTTTRYTGQYADVVKFLIYNWLFKWFIIRTLKSILNWDKHTLRNIYAELSGAAISIPSLIKSIKINNKAMNA